MIIHQGGMQLLHQYRVQLEQDFLRWYIANFKNPRMDFVHWSAGMRNQNFPEYHKVILEASGGEISVADNCPCDEDMRAHTDGRNTNSFAICVASMYSGGTTDLGPNAPTPAQLRHLVQTVAAVHVNLRIPVSQLMTHQEAADMVDMADPYDPHNPGSPPYGPERGKGIWACYRWDFWVDIDPSTLQLHTKRAGDPVYNGRLFFPDWLRGEVVLAIQKMTEHQWRPAEISAKS